MKSSGLELSRPWNDLEVVSMGVCDVTGEPVCVAHLVGCSATRWARSHVHARPAAVNLELPAVGRTHLRGDTDTGT